MKMMHALIAGLALATSAMAAQAHDAFNIGISIGGHGHYGAPVVRYHAVPQVIYYDTPRSYRAAPHAHRHLPVIQHRHAYYGAPHHQFSGYRDGRNYDNRGHRGHHRR